MIKIEVNKMIDAPIDKVWSIVSDLDNEPKYWHGTKSVKNLEIKDNRVFREVIIAFKNSKCKEIVSIEPNKIDVEIVEGPMKGHKIITLKEIDGKTNINVIWDIRLAGLLSMFSNMVKGHIEEGTVDALERIRKECESN